MTGELQISIRLEDEPDVVYPDSDEDEPEIDGLKVEPVYSEVQQALIARSGSRDDVLVAGNSFIYYKMNGHPERTLSRFSWLRRYVPGSRRSRWVCARSSASSSSAALRAAASSAARASAALRAAASSAARASAASRESWTSS